MRDRLVEGWIAFLHCTAEADHARVRDDADAIFIENGLIGAQTIHETLHERRV